MAHRIYLYNVDEKSNDVYPSYLGEWKYEIPFILIPLFSGETKANGKLILSEKEEGIKRLKLFYQLLEKTEHLDFDVSFKSSVDSMFEFLEDLPFSHFELDSTDVFNMNEESHKQQAKDWVWDISEEWDKIEKAIQNEDVSTLVPMIERRGYASFKEILTTDWINYGLGYFEYETYLKDQFELYEVDARFGIKLRNGKIITDALYDEIFDWSTNGYAVVRQSTKFGYLNQRGELTVPCNYDDAFDAEDFDTESFGTVALAGKLGIVNCANGDVVLEAIYDTIESLSYNFYNISKDNVWQVYDIESKKILPIIQDSFFEFEYDMQLFYSKINNSSKFQYFTKEGTCLGEFPKDVLGALGEDFFVVKPNKFDKKYCIIKWNGEVLDSEIDKLLYSENDDSFAYKKEGNWYLYDAIKKRYVLEEYKITKVEFGDYVHYHKDLFTVYINGEMGLFNIVENTFFVETNSENKSFNTLAYDYLNIKTDEGFYYFDFKTKSISRLVDWIILVAGDYSDKAFQFVVKINDALYGVDDTLNEILIHEENYGKIDEAIQYSESKDIMVWNQFYDQWKKRVGEDYELKFDAVTVKKLADQHFNEDNYAHALKLYLHAAKCGEQNAMIELGLLYTNPEMDFYNIREGLFWNEQAVKLGNPMAYNNLGYFYQQKIGYVFDKKKMIEAYQKAADLGDGMAMGNLGDLYFYGDLVKQDYDKALYYYHLASEKLYDNSKNIAEIYYQKNEFDQLLKCLKKDWENTYSNIYYGIMYDEGLGVKHNPKKAVKYYEKAMQYDFYSHALERLLFYYSEKGELANTEKWKYWKSYGDK